MAEHLHNDTIEELLRQHLLKQGGPGGPNESLLQHTAEKVFESPADLVPPAGKEAEMLARLKADFPPKAPPPAPSEPSAGSPPGPQPGPASGSWLTGLKLPMVLATVAALAITLSLLIVQPFSNNEDPSQPQPDKEITLGNGQGDKGEEVAMVTPRDDEENDVSSDLADKVIEEGNDSDLLELADRQSLEDNPDTKEMASTDASELKESAMNNYRSPNSNDLVPGPVDQPSPILALFAQTTVPSQFKEFPAGEGALFWAAKAL